MASGYVHLRLDGADMGRGGREMDNNILRSPGGPTFGVLKLDIDDLVDTVIGGNLRGTNKNLQPQGLSPLPPHHPNRAGKGEDQG